eukprot:TRINITY_DN17957_c0_g1_i1.p1 TRINITY_DN17957_c0_g1~~TRINITY_DN17957_c0_g1_i1.p1  ORF type:complete len:331 (-),score=61.35 TRINITY_DN17957_c0_g1_i1:243-1145(-)
MHHIHAMIAWMLMRAPSLRSSNKSSKDVFLPDEELSAGFIYRIITLLFYRVAKAFHSYEAVGLEKLPPNGEGCLLVSIHTTHNIDIFTIGTMLCNRTGRAPRGLLHRQVYLTNPWTKHIGMVPGDRKAAVSLLKNGFVAACLPGGGEEAMCGHESAYRLHERWGDRRGFAHAAKEAGVPIYPIFTQNAEEMRFNPVFWLGNKLRIGQLRLALERLPVLGKAIKNVNLGLWFMLSYATAIPVPVKITTFIGDPIETDGKSVDEIAVAARIALQAMIDEKQPHGHAYLPGLKSRFANAKKLE